MPRKASMVWRRVNWSITRSRARLAHRRAGAPGRAAVPGRRRPSSRGSRGGTTRPVSPTASRTPPTSVETVARPQDIASMRVNGKALGDAGQHHHVARRVGVAGCPRPGPRRRPRRRRPVRRRAPRSAPGRPRRRAACRRTAAAAPPAAPARTRAKARISVSRSLIGSTRPAQVRVGDFGFGPGGREGGGVDAVVDGADPVGCGAAVLLPAPVVAVARGDEVGLRVGLPGAAAGRSRAAAT